MEVKIDVHYLDAILLYGIERLDGERTTAGLYHLLNGKKSSQTVQDGRLFHLSHLFSILKGYSFNDFQAKINALENKGWIEVMENSHANLTKSGKVKLQFAMDQQPLPETLDGWRYGDISSVFWRRLTLFVQTLSHILNGDHQFHPIQNDPETLLWVKKSFPKDGNARSNIASKLFKELLTILRSMDEHNAENVVLRLTRAGRIGLTTLQVADKLQLDPLECHIHFHATLHHIVEKIQNDSDTFMTLHHFIVDMENQYILTESTRKTYQLINRGLSLEEVASIRRLKPSTIEDHIVELAIHVPNMDIDRYITESDQIRITDVSRLLGTKRLKSIRQELSDDLSYFQIRLALAKHSVENRSTKGEIDIVD